MAKFAKFRRIRWMALMLVAGGWILGTGCHSRTGRIDVFERDSTAVAVLPFTTRGPGLGEGEGHICADHVTALLYRTGWLRIVERSLVNASLKQTDINNPYWLSREALEKLCGLLGVSRIVLGTLEVIPPRLDSSGDKRLYQVTLRILDGHSGELLALAKTSGSGKSGSGYGWQDLLEAGFRDLMNGLGAARPAEGH